MYYKPERMEVLLIAAAGLIARDLATGVWEDGGWDRDTIETYRAAQERAHMWPRSKSLPGAKPFKFYLGNNEVRKGPRGVRIEESGSSYYGHPLYKAYVGFSNIPVLVGNPKAFMF